MRHSIWFVSLLLLGCTGQDLDQGSDAGHLGPDAGSSSSDAAKTGTTDADAADAGSVDPVQLCPKGSCNLITNEGCSPMACRYLSLDGVSKPVPVCELAGKGPAGIPCFTQTNCGQGLMCSMLSSTCVRYCCGGSDASCGKGTFCLDIWDGVGYCEPDRKCNLFNSGDCGKGESCLVVNNDGATICLERGASKQEGEICDFAECGVGMQCAKDDGEKDYTCKRYCNVSDQSTCDVNTRCKSEKLKLRPDIGMCNDVSDPCSGSPNSGACTNKADCSAYEIDMLGTVSAAMQCAKDTDPAGCVVKKTGLSSACANCFSKLSSSNRASFLSCAGF